MLDGGTLPGGEPYLVMEYVQGCDIAIECDQQGLSLSDRLTLLCRVCEAVQFAHTNLVIHRDIKPANVYVDPTGTPRLLDFGIASLVGNDSNPGLSHPDSRDTRLTRAYASPGQCSGQAVTTASDVYSLGALLYRLLTDQAPPDDEGRPPATPSAKLNRQVKAEASGVIMAYPDAVVGKALDRDPDQRYRTPQALSEELVRLQTQRPTRARPLGRLGRLSRTVRRNRVLSATLLGSTLMVLAFTVSVAVLAVHLDRERNRALLSAATTEQVSDFVFELFDGADPEVSQGEVPSARDLLDRGAARIQKELDGQDRIRARLLHRMDRAYQGLGQFEQAREHLAAALESLTSPAPDDVGLYWSVMVDLADIERELGLLMDARERLDHLIAALAASGELARQALAVELPAGRERDILHTRFRHNLAQTLGRQRRHEEAIELLAAVIDDKQRLLGDPHPSALRSMEMLATHHRHRGDYDAAAAQFAQVIDCIRDIYSPSSGVEARANEVLANVHHDRGNYASAERAFRKSLTFHDNLPGNNPLLHAIVVNNLASLFEDRGNLVDAESLFRRSLTMRQQLAGDEEITVIHGRATLARVLIKQGAFDEAETLLDQVDQPLARHFPDNRFRQMQLDWQRALLVAGRGDSERGSDRMKAVLDQLAADWPNRLALQASAKMDLAALELARGAFDAAGQYSLAALENVQANKPADHPDGLRAQVLYAQALAAQGNREQARELLLALLPILNDRFSPAASSLISAQRLIDGH